MADARSVVQKNVASAGTTPATATAALANNTARVGWSIQNASTNALFVFLGTAAATSSNYHYVLKACTGANDGSGGSVSQTSGSIYTGPITIGGTSPSYAVLEL